MVHQAPDSWHLQFSSCQSSFFVIKNKFANNNNVGINGLKKQQKITSNGAQWLD